MLTITRIGQNRLNMTLTGKLHSEEMRKVLDEFVELSKGIVDGSMLCDVEDFELPTPKAMMVEYAQMPRLLRVMGQFRKAAVMADEAWIKRISEFEGFLIPGLEVRGFNRDAHQQAEDWLDDSD